jgi:uncharacterized protein YuzB (UPF0349 family)
MGIVIVEVCESNFAAALDVESLEDQYDGVSVMRNYCLSYCELCAKQPYMLVNGEIVMGDDLESLMQNVCKKIENELAEWR